MSYKACLNCFAPLTGGPVCPRCGFDNAAYRPQPHHLPPGAVLQNRYVVGRAMGQGGFGITYVGFNLNLDRKVAVKEYFPDGTAFRESSQTSFVSCSTSESARERYRAGLLKCMNEAKSLAKLDDIPGIVRVMEYFQENDTVYIIMEFVEGVTLVSWLKRLPQRPGYREALELLSPIGAALEKIHARGFVHRDISPDNIMIDRDGAVKLLDFGAVKTVTESGAVTKTPVIKRGFSPLEMYSTEGMIGPWSDIYAYCATLCYILTGNPVPEPMNRLQKDTLGESLSRTVSPAQAKALLKGLAIQPNRRYQTAAEMNAALNACRSSAASIPETVQIKKRWRKQPEPAAAPKAESVKETARKQADTPLTPESVAEKMAHMEPIKKPAAAPEPPFQPAPKATDAARKRKTAPAPEDGTDTTQAGKKKNTAVILAVIIALAVLCVAIIVASGRSSDRYSDDPATTASTTKAPTTTQTPTTTSAPTTTQTPTTTSAPTTTQAPATTSAPATTQAPEHKPANDTSGGVNVGDYMTFGTYEQDNNKTNGKEAIEWLVLAKEDGKALLISRYGLDCQKYNDTDVDVTWETCTLRKWLNGTFLKDAFSPAEQGRILSGTVTADRNPDYETSPGNDTTDRIFLLSVAEADRYFSSNDARQCKATAYAEARGSYVFSSTGSCWFWLRSPGLNSASAAYVYTYGAIHSFDAYAYFSNYTVRPALWISLTA